jgi:hypothetical protein
MGVATLAMIVPTCTSYTVNFGVIVRFTMRMVVRMFMALVGRRCLTHEISVYKTGRYHSPACLPHIATRQYTARALSSYDDTYRGIIGTYGAKAKTQPSLYMFVRKGHKIGSKHRPACKLISSPTVADDHRQSSPEPSHSRIGTRPFPQAALRAAGGQAYTLPCIISLDAVNRKWKLAGLIA